MSVTIRGPPEIDARLSITMVTGEVSGLKVGGWGPLKELKWYFSVGFDQESCWTSSQKLHPCF